MENKFYSIYRGEVADNNDPENSGRLLVKVPQVYDFEVYEYWANPIGIYSGFKKGFFFLPNVGDMVWVQFENGDPAYPVWQYGWWRNEHEIPTGAKPDINIIQTEGGNRIIMNDTDKVIKIEDPHGHVITLNEKGVSIESKNISLGSLDKSKEPIVLGDTAMDLLNEFITDLGNLKHIPTNNGMTYAINGSPDWQTLQNKWKTKWEEFKSKVTNSD